MKHRLSPMAGVWLGVLIAGAQTSSAAEVKVLTAGAFKQVVLAVVPEFEKQTGHKVVVDNDTVGGLTKKIEGGEQFDVVVLTPAAIDSLTSKGKISDGSKSVLARVGRRRDGQGRCAGPRHRLGRGLQARADQCQDGRLYRSGERRLERDLHRRPARPARHRRPDQAEGEAEDRAATSPISSRAARRSSASTRSARSCRSRK